MKFTVHRTSDCFAGRYISPNQCNPPLPNCVFEERTEKRLVKGGYWPDSRDPFYIEKDVSISRWILEVDSLEQLIKILADQEYSFIISKPGEVWPDYPDIEIYDECRE